MRYVKPLAGVLFSLALVSGAALAHEDFGDNRGAHIHPEKRAERSAEATSPYPTVPPVRWRDTRHDVGVADEGGADRDAAHASRAFVVTRSLP